MDLYFPPQFSYYQPYIALPSLKAFIERKGFQCHIHDLNIESFHYIINRRFIDGCLKNIKKQISNFEKKASLNSKQLIYYEQLIQARLIYPLVFENIDSAISFFKDEEQIVNFDKYQIFERVIDNAFKIVSAAYYPTLISLSDFSMEYSYESSIEIEAAIADTKQNPFIDFFKFYFEKRDVVESSNLIGISITATSQIIPAFTLAKLFRRKYPEKQIVLGGVISNHLEKKLTESHTLNKYFDYLINGEGETALLGLLEYLGNQSQIEKVPNLFFKKNNEWLYNNNISVEKVQELPIPNYDGFPLDAYLAPQPILSVEPGRGCYYRKCTFCNQHSIHKGHFNIRNIDSILDQIRVLKNKYKSNHFNLSNEGIPVRHLKKLALKLIEEEINIYWYAGARLSDKLDLETCQTLYRSGCRKLLFGLESGNQRILDLMKKNVNIEDVPEIFRNCKNAGINIVTYLMIGFPTEEESEMDDTTNFIIKNIPNVLPNGFVFYISVFQAMIDSPILNLLSQYGYKTKENPQNDLTYIFPHEKNGCSSKYSRAFLEKKSAEMKEQIYNELPPQTVPQNISHFMFYGRPKTLKEPTRKNRAYLNDENKIQISKYVSFAEAKGICSAGEKLVYSLLSNKYFIVNDEALKIMKYLEKPRTRAEIIHKFEETSSLNEYLNFAIDNQICFIR